MSRSIGRRHLRLSREFRSEIKIIAVRSGKGKKVPEEKIADKIVYNIKDAMEIGIQAASWKAKKVGVDTSLVKLASEINTAMPTYVVKKVEKALNSLGKTIKDSRILVLGLSYKKNIDDSRESPSLVIMDILIKKGADVQYSDPYLPKAPQTRKYNFDLKSVNLSVDNIKSFDAVILATDHDVFDYKLIEKESKLMIDTRGRLERSQKIIAA